MRKTLVSFFGLLSLTLLSCQQTQQYYSSCCPEVIDETYVHRYGVEVSPQDWNAGGNHGKIVTTLSNGVVVTKTYDSGILDGDTTYTFPHSSGIEKVESYMNGVLQKESSYYISGSPKQEILYNSPQNRTVLAWYESKAPKSKEQYHGNLLYQAIYHKSDNQLDSEVENYNGTRTIRDDYGQLVSIDTVDKGLMTLRSSFHPNGAPKEVIPYANDAVHGQVKTYFPAGEPLTVEEWKNGKRSGLTVEYLNGEKISDCFYFNGHKQGIEHRYRDGNTVVQEISWANGLKQGPSTTYVGNAIKKIDWYWQDKQISKANYDMMTGQSGTKKNIWNSAKG